MVKLLVCLFAGLVLAVTVLQLRQQRLELNYKISSLHRRIEAQQAQLWNQQIQIAVYTAPNAIQHTVGNHDLHLIPRTPPPRVAAALGNGVHDPDAE